MSEKIQFRGATYVEAASGAGSGRTPPKTKHKKCAPGTHWNEKQKKCMKLPPELIKASSSAHRASKKTDTALPKEHVAARDAHMKARRKHQVASKMASDLGFTHLAKEHEGLVRGHSDKAAVHDRKAFPNQQVD